MKILIVGNGGRESSLAWKAAEDSSVFAAMQHPNPTILHYVENSGGSFLIGDTNDGKSIADFARTKNVDIAFVSPDASLEAGVVDALLHAGIPTVGPTRAGAEIEWNKTFAMRLLSQVLPQYTPRYWIAEDKESLQTIFAQLIKEEIPVAVKPQGLTGGKGVKVMGEHLPSFDDAEQYALQIITHKIGGSTSVVIEEKILGPEFTLQVITDGKALICPPASYDHPYRFDCDKGPGTGGMGSFTDAHLPLPFMSLQDYNTCVYISEKIIKTLAARGLHFTGVLNACFFLSSQGIRVMEINARFGDPECMNIMTILDSPLSNLLLKITQQSLTSEDVHFKPEASVVKYLVAPEYTLREGKSYIFFLDHAAIEAMGVHVFFSSAIRTDKPNTYQTVGNSRVVGLATTACTIPEAAERIDMAISNFVRGPLESRRDIGTTEEISRLMQLRMVR